MDEQQKQIARIFLPHALREMDRVRAERLRFVHYTSAETGIKILRSGKMLLRNSTLMNDFSEVRHGMDCLLAAYNGDLGARLKIALRKVQNDLPEVLESNFNAEISDVLRETYLVSVSEHDGPHEDKFGRLSMWRAYAPKDGIAFVMNSSPFLGKSLALRAFTSPVVYGMIEEFQPAFEEIVLAIESNIEVVVPLGGKYVHEILMNAFRFAVQSTKHPSFKEEKEWRIIYSPTILRAQGLLTDEQMRRLPPEILPLSGIPQRVYSIPFKDYREEGFVGATVPNLIERVLIGPSQYAHAISQAYIAELSTMQVPDAHSKVVITGIPLRQ